MRPAGWRPQRAGGTIAVALGWRAGRLRISFVDDGRPFDPLAFRGPDLEEATEERGIGGLGIHIVPPLARDGPAPAPRPSARAGVNPIIAAGKAAREAACAAISARLAWITSPMPASAAVRSSTLRTIAS